MAARAAGLPRAQAATRRYTHRFGGAEDIAGLFVVAMSTLSAIIAGIESIRRLTNALPIGQRDYLIEAVQVGIIEMVHAEDD